MNRRTYVMFALAASSGILFTACGAASNPPCETLPPPTQVEIQAAREGAEVEREVEYEDWSGEGEAECVVVGSNWQDQTDDA